MSNKQSNKQAQAVQTALTSETVANDLGRAIRRALVLAEHAQATGQDALLTTLKTELADHVAFMSTDKSGELPAGTIVNPKAVGNTPLMEQKVEQKDPETGERVLGGDDGNEVQYDIIKVNNPKYNPNLATHVFQSTTGLSVDADGQLAEAGADIEVLLLRLVMAAALPAIQDIDLDLGDGQTVKFGDALEKVTTIKFDG